MVIIDLHGAQGSQNGFDNSGRRGNILFGQDDNMAKARDVLGILQHEFSDNHAVAAIEAVNEPIATVVGIDQLNQYYYDAWIINSDSPLVTLIHDGFLGASAWNSFGPGLDAIMIDTHHYEVFDISQLQMTSDAHAASACAFGSQLQGGSLWTIVGEWSGATTDCAKWLNGRGVGSRYDGTFNAKNPSSPYIDSCEGRDQGSVGTLSQQDQQNLRKFIEAQLQAYEKSQGWIFWTWKTESSPEWDMQQLFNAGIFPGDLTNITCRSIQHDITTSLTFSQLNYGLASTRNNAFAEQYATSRFPILLLWVNFDNIYKLYLIAFFLVSMYSDANRKSTFR